MDQMCIM